MMAVTNAKFMMADVEVNGRISDIEISETNTTAECRQKILPFVFWGYDAFRISENLIKPYP